MKLIICKHCGEKPELHYCNGDGGKPIGYYIACVGCCVCVGTFATESDAISAWNNAMEFGVTTPTRFEIFTKNPEALADLILKVQRYAAEGILPHLTKTSITWWLNQKALKPASSGKGEEDGEINRLRF